MFRGLKVSIFFTLYFLHFPCSPDLANLDFHLFRLLQCFSRCIVRRYEGFDELFEFKPENFYHRGIKKLIERWDAVENKNGEYIIEKFVLMLLFKTNFKKYDHELFLNSIHIFFLPSTSFFKVFSYSNSITLILNGNIKDFFL